MATTCRAPHLVVSRIRNSSRHCPVSTALSTRSAQSPAAAFQCVAAAQRVDRQHHHHHSQLLQQRRRRRSAEFKMNDAVLAKYTPARTARPRHSINVP